MWVQELFIDEFDGGGDLSLHQLSPTLNVIRVPSAPAAASLARFIPTLLYGQSSPQTPAQAGSLVVTHQTESGAWEVVDLCRLPLEGAAQLSELQLLAERGQVVDEDRLLERLEAVDGPIYRAVFTDDLPCDERLQNWQSADWIVPLLRRPERTPSGGPPAPNPDAELNRRLVSTRAWRRALARRRQPPQETGVASQVPAAGGLADEPLAADRVANREAYLRAREAVEIQRRRIGPLRQRQTQAKLEIELLARAAELRPQWDRLQTLRSQSTAAIAPVAAEDLDELRQLGRQATSIRHQLREVSEPSEPTTERRSEMTRLQQRNQQLAALLSDWSTCLQHQDRVAELRTQLMDQRSQFQDERRENPWIATQEAIGEVHRRARAVRAARQRVRQQYEAEAEAPCPPAAEMPRAAAASPPLDPQIDSLRRQIRQLREETRQLLQRQLLSRRALLGIGLLFSAGVAILLSAVLLNLDGAEVAMGSIGLTCIVAAALLKSSFERTPTYQLRRQRLRTAALLDELQRVQTLNDTAPTPRDLHPTVAPDTFSPPDDGSLLRESAQDELSLAERAWFEILDQLELAEDVTPREAVRALRLRGNEALADTANANAGQDRLSSELNRHQAAVDAWCHKVAQVLHDPALASDNPVPQVWFQRAQNERDRLVAELAVLSHRDSASGERSRLRQQLRQTQRRRRAILDRYAAQRLSELEQRHQAQVQQAAAEADRQRLEATFQTLPQQPHGDRILRWLEEGLDLEQQRDQPLQAVEQSQREIHEAQQAVLDYEAEIARRSARPQPSAAANLERPMAKREPDALAMDVAGAILAALEAAEPVVPEPAVATPPTMPSEPPRWLQTASQFLQHLWDDDAVSVSWEDTVQGPLVMRAEGSRTPLGDLTTEQRHALALALQLALVRCLGERVGHLPLVLSDRSFRSAPAIRERLPALLCGLAAAGQQILVVTVDVAISERFRNLDIPTLVVTRQAHLAGPPEAEDPHAVSPAAATFGAALGRRHPRDTEGTDRVS